MSHASEVKPCRDKGEARELKILRLHCRHPTQNAAPAFLPDLFFAPARDTPRWSICRNRSACIFPNKTAATDCPSTRPAFRTSDISSLTKSKKEQAKSKARPA